MTSLGTDVTCSGPRGEPSQEARRWTSGGNRWTRANLLATVTNWTFYAFVPLLRPKYVHRVADRSSRRDTDPVGSTTACSAPWTVSPSSIMAQGGKGARNDFRPG